MLYIDVHLYLSTGRRWHIKMELIEIKSCTTTPLKILHNMSISILHFNRKQQCDTLNVKKKADTKTEKTARENRWKRTAKHRGHAESAGTSNVKGVKVKGVKRQASFHEDWMAAFLPHVYGQDFNRSRFYVIFTQKYHFFKVMTSA